METPDYDHNAIENKWVERWEAEGAFRAAADPEKPKRYVLVMFPYPSGPAHMGHVANYSLGDVVARYYTRIGYSVLHPMGYDAFGLPAENAAISGGIHPARWTRDNIELIRNDLKRLGYSYDWSRELSTCEPEYYRWTQWFFLKMFERGLAYKADATANWCPACGTVLANEQVLGDGTCERCSTFVEERWLNQWFFRIKEYAERLLVDMDLLEEWPERVLTMQRNWIGKSHGADVEFTLEATGEKITIYTTRPDTLFGVTFFLLAPEHPLVDWMVQGTEREAEVAAFRERLSGRTEFERTALDAVKDGVFLGHYVTNPVNGERVPVYTANFVLFEYGTGAVMAVPAHDQRDFEFARKYDLPVRVVIQPPDGELVADEMTEAYEDPGTMVASPGFDGTPNEEGKAAVCDMLEGNGWGRRAVNYRLRDWLISRQRYWGVPIPIVYCEKCGTVPVPEEDLPVILPEDLDLAEGGRSPLPLAESFWSTTCPECGGPAKRETDTMDTFVDSSWYYFRYVSPRDDSHPFDPEETLYWMPVDQYIGGIEHAIMHLLYSRFFTKVIHDLGLIDFKEPFSNLLCQGMITKDGAKMSKSKGNVVTPGDYIDRLGADTLRLYILFMGPPEVQKDWSDAGVEGAHRFLGRVWRMVHERCLQAGSAGEPDPVRDRALLSATHRTIMNVTRDLGEFAFNTAVSFIMELVNAVYQYTTEGPVNREVLVEAVRSAISLLAPFTPFITEELWRAMGEEGSVHQAPWPTFDEVLARPEEVTLVVQVNGKVRDKITVPADISEDEMRQRALASENTTRFIGDKAIRKVVVVPGKLVNIVI
ncbi:MAG: leucine--tRNA ligase [Actinobacteria bacterium]|nr:leucine--tRNA ligase [Actinomycetota bacterium]MBU1943545.1 leucine--tRNA ligase [Actinomycetota bacterium]MBU2687554.1 leucine--tRNA ligase [Actinomycetota bacterium]